MLHSLPIFSLRIFTIATAVLAGSGSFMQPAAGVGVACDPAAPAQAIFDLGSGTYKTFEGGFYAGGANTRPAAHESAGLAIAHAIRPLDVAGEIDPDSGAIVLMSIGFSNMTQEWASGAVGEPASRDLTFRAKVSELQKQGFVNPQLVMVDGATGGATVDDWAQPPNPNVFPWNVPIARLGQAKLTRYQVQVAAVKTSMASPTECIADNGSDTGFAGDIAAGLAQTARNLKQAFPNLKMVYFICRSYGGYALTGLNPEPFAYELGFSIKWVVNAQIHATEEYGNLQFDGKNPPAPWLSYGPSLWANGETPNGQGLSWSLEDFRENDRTHPSGSGVDKASDVFLNFFIDDTTTRPWFLTPRGRCDADLDATDAVDVFDLFQLLRSWGPCGEANTCEADFDDNGVVNIFDLFDLLNMWGECSL